MLIRRISVYALSLILALGSLTSLGLTSAALAQGSTGRLAGTVSTADGVIAGAAVVVKDNQTGKEQRLTTNSEGGFQIPQIEFGIYTVTVTAQGFKTYTATDLKIDVGKEYSLNITLEVGAVTENVTVTAGAEVINSSNAELSNTVSPRQIQELPLNGRNPLALVTLQPGTSSNGAAATVINGQRQSFANITRDGINVQDNFIRSNAIDFVPDRPNVDDVGEFTIVTQNAGAELGYGSSQIQFVTPRGSNQFHGSAYIYNRNSAFSANSFFNNAGGNFTDGSPKVPLPFLNRNQFGGTVRGPIIKDKFFFFGGYEGFRVRQSTSSLRTILVPQARSGIFTYLDNTPVAQGGPIRRTINVLALAGLPADPIVQSRFLDNIPSSGNSTDAGDQLNTTGFRVSRLQNQNREAITSRFDYEINQNNSVNVVYSYKKEFLLRPDVDNGGFTSVPFGFQDANTPFLSVSYRMTPTARISNELRGGFQFSDPFFGSTGENVDAFVTLPLITNPESSFRRQGRDTKIINFQDNVVYAVGQHSFRFGGQAQLFKITSVNDAGNIPTYALGTNSNTATLAATQFPGGISSTQLGTANSLLALLAGIVSSGTQTFNVTSKESGFVKGATQSRRLNYSNYSGYFSDQWRVKPQLTLNLGLRYEMFMPVKNPDQLALEPVIPDGADPVAVILNPLGKYAFVGGNAGKPGRFFKPDKNNFAPIISFAWAPEFKNGFLEKILPGGGKSVLRGGYRESYVNDEFVRAVDNALIGNAGLSTSNSAINPLTGNTALNARLNALPAISEPTFQLVRTFADNNTAAFGRFGSVFAIDPNLKVPRTQEYNFGIQREIGFQTAIEVRYVGGRSTNLIRGFDYNQIDITNNGFLADFLRARSNFLLTGNPACPVTTAGCQALTVFPKLVSGGNLASATNRNFLQAGTPADMALNYIQLGQVGTVSFLPNPNTGVADLLLNASKYYYNSLQAELRRRFSSGLYFQANYTFQKTLTDAGFPDNNGQTRFLPPLDLFHPDLEYARADYDQTHVFNLNTIYELPFGKGKPFLNQGGWVDKVLGGYQVTSIIRWGSGAPLSILDARGTFNRAARATRQTARSSLNKDEIKNLIGIRKTKCGVFFIDPAVINYNLETCNDPNNKTSLPGTGRAANGFGTATFPGQVFFNNGPGEVGTLERTFINGPVFFNWDASIIKFIPIKESVRLQLRLEAFNVINRANFFSGDLNINSANFGRVTSTFAPRVIQLVGRIEF